jgi:aspartate dehydrogenase
MPLNYSAAKPLNVALAGFGNVGRALAVQLNDNVIPAIRLSAISARDLVRARDNSRFCDPAPHVLPATELPEYADVIIECATYDAFRDIVEPAVQAGKTVIAVSVGALAVNLDLIDLAAANGGCIQIANGAMPGLDIVRCAAESTIQSVLLSSRIRPESLAHEQYILDQGFDFSTLPAQPVKVFQGSAREAAAAFPRHFNVAVALSLAGIGLDRTQIEVFADSSIAGTVHQVRVESDVAVLELASFNRPSEQNKRTSRLVAPSILAALRALVAPLRVGS